MWLPEQTTNVTIVSRPLLLPTISIWVSSSQRKKGQEDICFMSASNVALGFKVIFGPVSACCRNMDLSFLKETLHQRVDSLRRTEERKNWREVKGKGWGETVGNDNVCEAISPRQGPLHPGGGLGATRLQPQRLVWLLSLMTLPRQLVWRQCLQYIAWVYSICAWIV